MVLFIMTILWTVGFVSTSTMGKMSHLLLLITLLEIAVVSFFQWRRSMNASKLINKRTADYVSGRGNLSAEN
ncbi:MAG: hypothetical protein WBK44_04800 [Smithellaceae bacterium]|nr:hypothetical protein [Smithellaceae bacterium]HPW23211.1 hypothetical protein [Smithellaceae bacterium]